VPAVAIWQQSQLWRWLARAGVDTAEAACRNQTVARLRQLSRGCDNCRAAATKARASQPVIRRLDAEAAIENGLPWQQDCRLASRCGGVNGNE
tara:strand:+ start:329 stop:607 length:279 start_codon:yes stop_codon:yes gene_type:complete